MADIKYHSDEKLVRHIRFNYGGPVGVADIYSPPRVTVEASKYELKPGEAFDLTNGFEGSYCSGSLFR